MEKKKKGDARAFWREGARGEPRKIGWTFLQARATVPKLGPTRLFI